MNPILGVGYGAFWNLKEAVHLENSIGWAAPSAHNGFIQTFLNTGLVGLIFIFYFLYSFWQRSRILKKKNLQCFFKLY